MDIHSVVQEITSAEWEDLKQDLEIIIGNGNFIFFKESFLDYCKEDFSPRKIILIRLKFSLSIYF